MVSSRELQRLAGFLEGKANYDFDARSALLLSDAGTRKSARSKPPVLEAPEVDLVAKEAPARKVKTSTDLQRKPKASASKSQSSVEEPGPALDEDVVSSISTLTEPPSEFNLDGDEFPIPPPAKRQKRNAKRNAPHSRVLIIRLKFNDAKNREEFNDIVNAHTDEAHLNDADHSTSDVNDGSDSRTETEIDDTDDGSDYAFTSAEHSRKGAQKMPQKIATALKRSQTLKAALPPSARLQEGLNRRRPGPFLERSRKLGQVTPPATPNGIFSIEPLPFYEDRTESGAAVTLVPVSSPLLNIRTTVASQNLCPSTCRDSSKVSITSNPSKFRSVSINFWQLNLKSLPEFYRHRHLNEVFNRNSRSFEFLVTQS